MSQKHTGQTIPEITQEEHDSKNVNAKKVSLWGYLPDLDELARITAVDNGDGTFSIKTTAAAGAVTNDGTFATETGNLASLASGQVDGSQITQLKANGTTVDSAHPLPIAGTFADSGGVPYSTSNRLPVDVGDLTVQQLNVSFPPSVISTANTTTTPLAANATFTGVWEDVTQYSGITATLMTDQPSATDGAKIQFSADGTNVLTETTSTVPANLPLSFTFPPQGKYFRVIYTNGATAQTMLQAQILYSYITPSENVMPLATTTNDLYLSTATQAHLKVRTSTGAWLPAAASDSGKLQLDLVQPTTPSDVQPVQDDYATGEILADQTGSNAVLTFSFSSPVNFVWVTDSSTTTTNILRVDPFGGTPSASLGIPVFNQAASPISVTPARSTIKVYAPSGAVVSCYGYRR